MISKVQRCILFPPPIFEGTEEEQIQYCFNIYDLNGDGYISREEMLAMLKTCLGRQGLEDDPEEGVKVGWNIAHVYRNNVNHDILQDLIEMTLRKMDKDKDGRVSFSDWCQTMRQEPLMLEAFGPCLPGRRASELFLEKSASETQKGHGPGSRSN